MNNQKNPEVEGEVIFVEYDPKKPEIRDVYLFINDYILGGLTVSRDKLKRALEQNNEEILETIYFYIKSPDGTFYRAEILNEEGLTEIDPLTVPAAQKLDWAKYDKRKFLQKDKAVKINGYLLFEDDGLYRMGDTTVSRDEEENIYIEKTASDYDKYWFKNMFLDQMSNIHTFISIHNFVSRNRETSMPGEEVVESDIDTLEMLEKNILDNFNKFNIGEETTQVNNQINTLKRAEDALVEIFDSILTRKEDQSLRNEVVIQGNVKKAFTFIQILNKTVQQAFIQVYEARGDVFTDLDPVKVSKKNSRVDVFNHISLRTDAELDYFEQLVLSAYKTWLDINPGESPTFLDIANVLHHPKSKNTKLSSRSPLIRDIADSFDILRTSLCRIDFIGQARDYKDNSKFQNYLNKGGSGIISFPYVSGVRRPIKTSNGDVLDGIEPDSGQADRLLWDYVAMTGQVRTIHGDALINPLRATRDNVKIFHYLLLKACSMPYDNRNSNFFKQRQKYISMMSEAEPTVENDAEDSIWKKKSEAEKDPEPEEARALREEMTKQERATSKRDLTISLDSLIEDLKLIGPDKKPAQRKKRRNTIKNNILKVFDHWKDTGFINDYSVKPKPREGGVQSFTLYFFDSPKK